MTKDDDDHEEKCELRLTPGGRKTCKINVGQDDRRQHVAREWQKAKKGEGEEHDKAVFDRVFVLIWDLS